MFVLFGGSFDPVHVGHIVIARDVREHLQAEKVIFIPAAQAPLKEGHGAPALDRLRMLQLAVEKEEGFAVEDLEIRRGGVSYTVDTLRDLLPELGSKPYFLLGADSVLRLHLWREPERILDLVRVVVVDRGGKMEEVKRYLQERFPEKGKDTLFLPVRRIDISATEIRRRVREGKSIYCMVPEKVEEYIRERGLYR